MFFGLCIYETLFENGRLDSLIITPEKNSHSLLVDQLRDIGPKLESDVDLGPLRFYTREHGLSVRTANSMLRSPQFNSSQDELKIDIQHLHLPLPQSHAGYYMLLLPSGFSGRLRMSPDYGTVLWLEDTQQMFISLTATPDHNLVNIQGHLQRSSNPPPDAETTTTQQLFGHSLPNVYYNPVDDLIRALRHSFTDLSPSAFICHSSADKEDARRLAINLATRGVRPWIDEAEIRTGDSLIDKIQTGINETTCLLPLLSEASVSSNWCKEELRMAMALQITGGGKRVLPIKLNDCQFPGFLVEKAYLNLSEWQGYDQKVDRLATDIRDLARAV